MGVGWRTSGLDALQRGIERKNGVKGTNQERRRFLLQSTLTNSCLEQGIQVRGVACLSCVLVIELLHYALYYNTIAY